MVNFNFDELAFKMSHLLQSLDSDQRAQVYQTIYEIQNVSQSPTTKVFVVNSSEISDEVLEEIAPSGFVTSSSGIGGHSQKTDSSSWGLATIVQMGDMVISAHSAGSYFTEALSNCKQSLLQALRHIRELQESSTERAQKVALLTQEKGRFMLH
ncbi:MAG: hypothetical protein NZ480_05965 [Bdellovibrionaceae bacterium]|nr:hypothetical protein [Pseudobdellovibrionaceae bacterium]MDW8190476.1 hypothetical protein [Pseudobdellovibrionaceae bacterium]